MWTRTTVPAITATGKDQSMGISARSWSDQILGFGPVLSLVLVYRFSVLCVARLCTRGRIAVLAIGPTATLSAPSDKEPDRGAVGTDLRRHAIGRRVRA